MKRCSAWNNSLALAVHRLPSSANSNVKSILGCFDGWGLKPGPLCLFLLKTGYGGSFWRECKKRFLVRWLATKQAGGHWQDRWEGERIRLCRAHPHSGKKLPAIESAAGSAGWRKNSRYEKRGKGRRYWEKSREISVVLLWTTVSSAYTTTNDRLGLHKLFLFFRVSVFFFYFYFFL